MNGVTSKTERLLAKGVIMPAPETVWIAPDVDESRICPGAVVYPGCRISGSETFLGPGAVIGAEAPVTLINSQLGAGAAVAGGFLDCTTMLDGSHVGSGAHLRPGTLMEERSSAAHTVGLKQTVLMPYVTLGSLINFCDVLIAGGSGPENHSEVGSSYVHFNFTPRQDKATASLIGDVPRGVWLNMPPVFLGGQGGLVGPRVVEFGTTVAAGVILRGDVTESGILVSGCAHPVSNRRSFDARRYGRVDGILANCLKYIGNIDALAQWYSCVRLPAMSVNPHGRACAKGALKRLAEIRAERILRLEQLAEKLNESAAADADASETVCKSQKKFVENWRELKKQLETRKFLPPPQTAVDSVLESISASGDYISGIKTVSGEIRGQLTDWLVKIAEMA